MFLAIKMSNVCECRYILRNVFLTFSPCIFVVLIIIIVSAYIRVHRRSGARSERRHAQHTARCVVKYLMYVLYDEVQSITISIYLGTVCTALSLSFSLFFRFSVSLPVAARTRSHSPYSLLYVHVSIKYIVSFASFYICVSLLSTTHIHSSIKMVNRCMCAAYSATRSLAHSLSLYGASVYRANTE